MSPPRVSVVMTTYDGERFLSAAIESILNQTFFNLELIVVDDGSTDSSARIIRSFSESDSRVRGIYLARNVGIAKAANCGLRVARGEYVARMDSDDLCHRDRLLKQVSYLDKHKRIHVIGCDYRAIDEEDFFCTEVYAKNFTNPVPIVFGKYRVAKEVFRFSYPVLHPTIVIRRSIILSVGGYREFLPIGEDDDLYFRVVNLHGSVLDNLSEKLYYYRRHSVSTTQRFNRSFVIFIISLITISSEFRRRGFWDPLEESPSSDCNSLRFRGVSAFLYLQDSVFYHLPDRCDGLYSLLRIVIISRRFSLKSFHRISLWNQWELTIRKQIFFYRYFCSQCFRFHKHRAGFLYLRYILKTGYYFMFLSTIFNILNIFSDKHLCSFRSLIFSKRFHYGLKYLVFAFLLSPFYTTKFFVTRFYIHSLRIMHVLYRKLEI